MEFCQLHRFIKTTFSGKGESVCAKSAKVLISLYMKNSLFPYLIKGKGQRHKWHKLKPRPGALGANGANSGKAFSDKGNLAEVSWTSIKRELRNKEAALR